VCCLEMTTKRKLIGRLVPCRCFRGEEEIVSVLDYSHCGLQQVPKEVFNFERTLEELYLDANQIEELPKKQFWPWKFLRYPVPGSGVTAAFGSSLSLLFRARSHSGSALYFILGYSWECQCSPPCQDQPFIPVGHCWEFQGWIQDFPENIKCCKCLTIIEASVNPVSK
ncbi:LRRC7 protein, partial [Prunella himalayana]|nr:LRRC7 protein [Prunella himalayana]